MGGGLHSSGEGGILAPHTDFHVYDRLKLYRRVNVIIYFNNEWSDVDGGSLELSEKGSKSPLVSILPVFGRMVVFNTDDRSVHGFTKPIAKGKRRNSIALYYYTANEAGVFSGDRTTHWQMHGKNGLLNEFRIGIYKTLLLVSRIFSKLAHVANPNMTISAKSGVNGERN